MTRRLAAFCLAVLSLAAAARPAQAQEFVTERTFRVKTGLSYGHAGVRMMDGTAGEVYAIERVGDDVYVGGRFDSVAEIRAANLARYHRPTRTWHPLGSGVDGRVRALEYVRWGVQGDYLYVGGHFVRTGSLHNGLAIWRPDLSAWQDAGGAPGTNSVYAGTDPDQTPGVYAIHKVPSGAGSAVYVGGTFDLVERWSGPESRTQERATGLAVFPGPGQAVQPASFGADNVRALASVAEPTPFGTTSHRLIVGGRFARVYGGQNGYAGQSEDDVFRNIAAFSVTDDRWIALGIDGGGAVPRGLDGTVLALTRNGTAVYAGGRFDAQLNGDGTALDGVAVLFDEPGAREAGWYAVLGALPGGDQSAVTALATSGDRLCIGGRLAGREPYDVACLDNGTPSNARETVVHAFAGGEGPGLVYALDLSGSDLLVGGQFSGLQNRDSGVVRAAHSLVSRVLDAPSYALFQRVSGLGGTPSAYAASSDRIYIAGITQVGAEPAGGLVVYTPSTRTFAALDASVRSGTGALVTTMLVSGDTLFVGGSFTEISDPVLDWRPSRYVARLDLRTQQWLPDTPTPLVSTTVSGHVGVMRLVRAADGRIYAGGPVDVRIGGVQRTGGVLRWNAATEAFEALALGLGRTGTEGPLVRDVAVFPDGTVAVAGAFDRLPQPGNGVLYTSNVAWLFPGAAAWTPRRAGTTSAFSDRYGPASEVYALTPRTGDGQHVLATGSTHYPFSTGLPPDTTKRHLLRSYSYGAGGAVFGWAGGGVGVNGPVYYAQRRGAEWVVAGDFTAVFQSDGTRLPVACLAMLDVLTMQWTAPALNACPDPGAPAPDRAGDGALNGALNGAGASRIQAIQAGTAHTGAAPFSPADFVFLDVSEMSVTVLPVELVAFSGVADGPDVRLSWETASETNSLGFYVESTADGAWRRLGFVPGAGTTAEAHAYTHRVPGIPPGTHRFRLRQVDTDGSAHVSAVVEVAVLGDGRLALVHAGPHPTAGPVRVAFDVPDERPVRLVLFDVLGRRVSVVADGAFAPGRHRVEVPRAGLAAGLYLLRLDHPAGARTLPLVLR